MPSDAKLMQIAIDDLNNSSLSLEDRHRALHELLVLVEPIDNANGNWKHKLAIRYLIQILLVTVLYMSLINCCCPLSFLSFFSVQI